jgi:hypothetical protein
MEQPTRKSIFDMAAMQLRQDFESLKAIPHAGARGGEAEGLLKRFLLDHIPRRFDVGSGFIIDPRDSVSRQTDVIIYDALNCPAYRASPTAGIYPANNVAAVVEVKSNLTGQRLTDAFDNIESVKRLAKVRTPDSAGLMDQTHGSIFAFKSSLSLDTIADRYLQRFKDKGLGPHTDLICVLDKGIIVPVVRVPGVEGWAIAVLEGLGGLDAEGSHVGVAVQQLGTGTLDAYLRLLLAQLTLFRSMVDHPGFGWGDQLPGGMMKVTYLTSVTNEPDPQKRRKKLDEYARQAREEMSKSPVPKDWPR